jgi:hypothetical protein
VAAQGDLITGWKITQLSNMKIEPVKKFGGNSKTIPALLIYV